MKTVKGSWSRVKKIDDYANNFAQINWGNKDIIYCFNCGGSIKKIDLKNKPELFIIHKDNSVEHKNCNFN